MPTEVERTVMERVRPVVTDTTDFYSFCQLNVTNLILFNTKSTNFTVFSLNFFSTILTAVMSLSLILVKLIDQLRQSSFIRHVCSAAC